MYKDWRLRNSTDLWRPNSSKHISANGTSQTAKTREKQQGWDGDCSEQAGAKMQQKYSPLRGLQRNENAAFSSDVLERSGRSKISPYSRSNGRCRSTSSSWNSRLSSGASDVTCRTSGARIAAHLRAEEESCQELAAEGQVMHRSVEQEDQTRPRSVESFRRTEETLLHPTTVRDIAIHPTLEDAQIKGDGNSYTPEDWDSTNSHSEPRHVQWQVTGQQSPNNSSSASTEAWKDLRDVETTRAESDSVFDDVQSQTRDMELKLRPAEDCKGFKTVAAEQKFGRPLNKFITGGALHALASLTRLDSSLDSSMDFEVERPGAATEDSQEAFQQNNHIREHLGESQVKDSMSCNAGPILPEKPNHPRALRALAPLPRLGFSEAERPDATTGDLQQQFEQRNHGREHFEESQVENLRSCNVGPILPEKPTQKKPFPATDSQGSSLANKSEGQSVIMRANIAFEPAVKEAPPVATVYMRKKIKMKAPTPKLSSKAKKPKPTACDAKDASVLQIGEREREDHGQKQNCPDDDCTILDAVDLESLRRSTTIPNDEAREDEKTVTGDARKPNTCVVTHNEHSIEVQELQDPPCRRRWPKVLPVCTSVSNRTDAERSSTSSICESLQEERILKGGIAESAAVQHGDLLEGEATNPSSKEALERLASTGAVSVDDGEERNTEQYKEGSEQQDCSSKDAAVGKTGLRICVPSASVREISINSASRIQPWTLSDAHRRQGEEGKLKRLGNEFQSNQESPASSALSYLSSRDPHSVMPEEELRGSQTLQESKSFPPVSNLPGPACGSPETFDHQGAIPERERDDPSNENSASTIIVSSNSSIAGRYPPALALATLSRGQPSQITPESIEFGRSVFNSAPPHEETYAERASLSSEKLSSILSYLGHVEESNLQENYNILQKTKSTCYSPNGNRSPRTVLDHDDSVSSADSTFTTTLTNVSNRSPTNSNANSGDGERNRNKAVSLFEGVRKKIQHYKDRIAGHESQNAELLKDMERVMADKEQTLSRERDKFGREQEKRAAEYEAAIQHHLALNEKMIKDKEALSEKWCKIAGILSTAESKFEEKLKAMQEQHTQDLKKQKELWIAGEKPRREAWKEMKLKEIKEITIKGLEPHIEGIVEKNKQELQKQEMRCADDKQKKLELQAIQHRKEMSELRDRLLKERDDLLEKERMAALQKMNEVAEKYEQQAMQLRMRVSGDMAAELERAEESRRKDKHDAHELLSKFQKEAAEREDTLRKGLESAMQDAISKREDEISKMKNEWQKVLDEKLQEEMQIKEQEIQGRCTKERDEQIEMIIERMDMEKDDAVNQQQQDLLVKVERLMEEKLDFMKRMKEVESKCATLCQLSLEAKKKAELELENRDLQVASLERELSCQSDLIEKLKAQINQEQSNLTQQEERSEKRIKKEQELLQTALRDVEKCNAEAQQMRFRKVEELAEVEAHVRQAIDNKDLVITGLREQLSSAREQIRHTEQLLLL